MKKVSKPLLKKTPCPPCGLIFVSDHLPKVITIKPTHFWLVTSEMFECIKKAVQGTRSWPIKLHLVLLIIPVNFVVCAIDTTRDFWSQYKINVLGLLNVKFMQLKFGSIKVISLHNCVNRNNNKKNGRFITQCFRVLMTPASSEMWILTLLQLNKINVGGQKKKIQFS